MIANAGGYLIMGLLPDYTILISDTFTNMGSVGREKLTGT